MTVFDRAWNLTKEDCYWCNKDLTSEGVRQNYLMNRGTHRFPPPCPECKAIMTEGPPDKLQISGQEQKDPVFTTGEPMSFDRAWNVIKAPWFDPEVEGQRPDQIQYPIEGPLYSGGDEMDDPKYWTTDMNEALAYALFGSAIPRSTINEEKDKKMKELFDRIGMRETIPTIFVADDPGEIPYDEEEYQVDMEHPDIQSYILDKDPHSDAYMHDELQIDRVMSRGEMSDMIQEILDRGPDEDFFQWGNTGSYKQPMERRAHMEGALERLKTGKRGNVDIPPEFLDSIDTAATDMHGHEGWDE